jgi:hypothetical protein
MGDTPPGATPNPVPPPFSYLASDAGKPGVPALRFSESRMLRAIAHYRPSKSLRFAWVDTTPPNGFIVYDATGDVCTASAFGYAVLNGACNEFYEPGENPYGTMAAPDCFGSEHRPWMTPAPR